MAGGDPAAGESLIEGHFDAVARFFEGNVGPDADDLVQRTFLRLAEGRASFAGRSSLRTFLFGIARNVLFEHLRGRVRAAARDDFGVTSLAALGPGLATLATRRAEQRVLAAALRHIPLELQVLVELFYWEELSIDELSESCAVPAGTIRGRLHRARTLLREAMASLATTPEEQRSARSMPDEWAHATSAKAAPARGDARAEPPVHE